LIPVSRGGDFLSEVYIEDIALRIVLFLLVASGSLIFGRSSIES